MKNLTPEGARRLEDVAMRHGVSLDAVSVLLGALAQSNGSQAQFNHPDLGGMGQWSQGGMIMVGDMFNHGLKQRVDALCSELASMLRDQPMSAKDKAAGVSLFVSRSDAAGQWWPSGLGRPASIGAQNDFKYAYFPSSSRLAILQDRQVRIYDTGEHRISGVSQQQSGDQSLTFTSQLGLVRVADLRLVNSQEEESRSPAAAGEPFLPSPERPSQARPVATTSTHDAIIATIERLAELRNKEIISEEEFAAKKAELLGRL
jgi:Short C-terminal domain